MMVLFTNSCKSCLHRYQLLKGLSIAILRYNDPVNSPLVAVQVPRSGRALTSQNQNAMVRLKPALQRHEPRKIVLSTKNTKSTKIFKEITSIRASPIGWTTKSTQRSDLFRVFRVFRGSTAFFRLIRMLWLLELTLEVIITGSQRLGCRNKANLNVF